MSEALAPSLCFKMAGFEILWASEFVEAARDTYRANFPGVHIDERDIRQVTPESIMEQTGLKAGELDVLEGSPPCASFSMAGKRDRDWGEIKSYSDTTQRTDDLFFEYARLLRGLQPKVFIAENVAGLVRGKAKGYFKAIVAELRDCGYDAGKPPGGALCQSAPEVRQRPSWASRPLRGVVRAIRLEPGGAVQ